MQTKAKIRRIFATIPSMSSRKCLVSMTGTDGIKRSVQVEASSVYDAAVLALQTLKQDSWSGAIAPGTKLHIEVQAPTVTHEVTVHQLRRWAESSAITPDDRVRKNRLRELLASEPVNR
jgi:hypothetical protein